jgi:hypothetical protein
MDCEEGPINTTGIVKTVLAVSYDALNRLKSADFNFYD